LPVVLDCERWRNFQFIGALPTQYQLLISVDLD
jgi:hypothetical protein